MKRFYTEPHTKLVNTFKTRYGNKPVTKQDEKSQTIAECT